MPSHSATKLRFNPIFRNQMRSKICPAPIKHVSYSIICVLYRTSMLQQHHALSLCCYTSIYVLVWHQHWPRADMCQISANKQLIMPARWEIASPAKIHGFWSPRFTHKMIAKCKSVAISECSIPCSVFHFLILATLAQFTCVLHRD